MRIIGGSARGRRLFAPATLRLRPTADRVKESLFNILSVLLGGFDGRRVLDLFAGTGNLGLEALSRGAERAVFVDNHRESVALIKKNVRMLGFEERALVLGREVVTALHSLDGREAAFDVVFIDPPYGQGEAERSLAYLAGSALLDDESVVVAESSSRELLPAAFPHLREFDRRIYGDTALAFFRREPADERS